MSVLISNEFKKFFKGKLFYFLIIVIIGLLALGVYAYSGESEDIINNTERGALFPNNIRQPILEKGGIDAILFAKLFLTDFIYKGYIPFFLIFIAILAVNTFSTDRENGNMKFTLLTGVNGSKLVFAKLIYMALMITLTVIFVVTLSLTSGFISFGFNSSIKDLFEYLAIAFMAILPAVALTVVVAIFSQMRVSSPVVMAVSIIICIALGISDASTVSYRFSPIGMLSLFANGENYPAITRNLLMCAGISAVFVFVGGVILKGISSKYEYYE